MNRFANRHAAGEALAEAVAALNLADPVVFALPRGGVPVAAPVAKHLGAPLDLILVRKIGTPRNPELAAGALVDGDPMQTVFNDHILRSLGLSEADLADIIAAERQNIEERRALYLAGRAPTPVKGRDAVVVDDGIATGATARAALQGLAQSGAASVTLAVPTAPAEARADFAPLADHLVVLMSPEPFYAVGQAYLDFGQTSDGEVRTLLVAS